MMKKIYRYVAILFTAFFVGVSVNAAETADAVLKKAAATINGAKSLTASFAIDYDGSSLSGTLQSSGKKFVLKSHVTSTWYDGKNMWTYNPKNNETTVMLPTPSEVAEANPLSLVNTYSQEFTAAYSKTQPKGGKTIVLTPKSKKSGYKSVHVFIADGDSFPSKITVIPSSGKKITVTVSNVKFVNTLPVSTFVYPAKSYPKAELVDLR